MEMEVFTTLRLRNQFGETGGEWFAETIKPYHLRLLKEARDEEPLAVWKLEIRGYSGTWRTYEPNFQSLVE